jgi:hypothetical protein
VVPPRILDPRRLETQKWILHGALEQSYLRQAAYAGEVGPALLGQQCGKLDLNFSIAKGTWTRSAR